MAKTTKELDLDKFVKSVKDEYEISPKEVEAMFRAEVASSAGKKSNEISDKDLWKAVCALHKSGLLDDTLRSIGLVPKPSFASALLGWHDVEHLRSKGWANKTAGGTSIAAKLTVLAYGGYRVFEYLTR